MSEHHHPLEGLREGGEPAERAEASPAPAIARPRCFLDGGPFCPAARAVVGAKMGLSPSQSEVASLVVGRLSDKEIARALDIRPKTVRSHLADISRLLSAHGRGEIVQKLLDAHAAWLADSPPNPPPPILCKLKYLPP